jgi:hypothetical protein
MLHSILAFSMKANYEDLRVVKAYKLKTLRNRS